MPFPPVCPLHGPHQPQPAGQAAFRPISQPAFPRRYRPAIRHTSLPRGPAVSPVPSPAPPRLLHLHDSPLLVPPPSPLDSQAACLQPARLQDLPLSQLASRQRNPQRTLHSYPHHGRWLSLQDDPLDSQLQDPLRSPVQDPHDNPLASLPPGRPRSPVLVPRRLQQASRRVDPRSNLLATLPDRLPVSRLQGPLHHPRCGPPLRQS